MQVKVKSSVVSASLRPHGLHPTGILCPWDFPGKSPGVGCHFLLQEIFPIQGSNLHFLHCRWMICSLSHQGRFNLKVQVAQSCPALCDPIDYTVHGILQVRILEWVAYPFSGDLPNPGIKPGSPVLQADSLPTELQGKS